MLHGEIKVNHHEIARWQAANLGKAEGGYTLYRCAVTYIDNAGYKRETGPFLVHHYPEQGALVLTNIVLAQAKFLFDTIDSQ